jgi:hypothetical protein
MHEFLVVRVAGPLALPYQNRRNRLPHIPLEGSGGECPTHKDTVRYRTTLSSSAWR